MQYSNLDLWFQIEAYTILKESIKSYIQAITRIMEASFRNGAFLWSFSLSSVPASLVQIISRGNLVHSDYLLLLQHIS